MEGRWTRRCAAALVPLSCAIALVCASCGADDAPPAPVTPGLQLTADDLLDSTRCGGCHPSQYKEWSGSMHAYAGDDPIFRALEKRMQRETNGALGPFCVQCHAPMVVRKAGKKDGLALDTQPTLKGVTCVFCHTATTVGGSNNNPVVLSGDTMLVAGISDPSPDTPHGAGYSPLLDGKSDGSPALCGPCHDIVTPAGAAIERTFREWRESAFGLGERTKDSCAKCHMPERLGRAAEFKTAPTRTIHDHSMVGVDVALTDFPERGAQAAAVQAALDAPILDVRLCITERTGGPDAEITLANRGVGHSWPSGSAQDRRAWVEVIGYSAGAVVFESGRVPDDASVISRADPTLVLFRDRDFAADGKETHLFWQAARVESNLLAARLAGSQTGASISRKYSLPEVDRVTARVRIRPVDLDILDELVASGDLDPSLVKQPRTFTLGKTVREWTRGAAAPCVE